VNWLISQKLFENSFDLQIATWFLSQRSDIGIAIFKIITFFASWEFIIFASVMVIIIIYLKNEKYLITPLFFIVGGTEITTLILKNLFLRPRFMYSVVETTTASFPSGHAAIALAFYGYLAYVMIKCHGIKKVRLIILVAVSIILLISVSRLYLGAHYLSDIVGAYLLSSVFLIIGIWMSNKRRKNSI